VGIKTLDMGRATPKRKKGAIYMEIFLNVRRFFSSPSTLFTIQPPKHTIKAIPKTRHMANPATETNDLISSKRVIQ
jgi:hypothetical protein